MTNYLSDLMGWTKEEIEENFTFILVEECTVLSYYNDMSDHNFAFYYVEDSYVTHFVPDFQNDHIFRLWGTEKS